MGSCAAMNDPPFICPLTLQLLWFIPVLYTSSLATNGASRSWARFWLFIGVWVFWCLLEQNDSSAFWERLPEMSYTTSVVCSCCSDAPKLQGQELRRALGGGSNTTGGSPLQPLMDPLSFTTGQRGPSPGEVFQLPSNPFLLPKLSQKNTGFNPCRPVSLQTFGWLGLGRVLQFHKKARDQGFDFSLFSTLLKTGSKVPK